MQIFQLNGPPRGGKVAGFDFDHTLCKPHDGNVYAKNVDDWTWTSADVPSKLRRCVDEGYSVLVVSTQTKAFKVDMIRNVLSSVGVPVTILVGSVKNKYELYRHLLDGPWRGAVVRPSESFFVGDAAGRPGDWSDADKAFAAAAGFAFRVPEEYFAFESNYPQLPGNAFSDRQEVVVMVGFPGSGKSTNAAKFAERGYRVISRDDLGTVPKMLREARGAITQGRSVVFDATNGTAQNREPFVTLARSSNIPARCVHVFASLEQSMENNKRRAVTTGKSVPRVGLFVYRKRFELPLTEEGFSEIVTLV